MTTIAYNHKDKQIACDGRITAGYDIMTDNGNKCYARADMAFYCSGELSDIDEFVDTFEKGKKAPRELETWALMVRSNIVYYCYVHDLFFKQVQIDHNFAIGRGADHALTAMEFGATAKEALECAMKFDLTTGGTVKVYDVN